MRRTARGLTRHLTGLAVGSFVVAPAAQGTLIGSLRSVVGTSGHAPAGTASLANSYGKLPLAFEANVGQTSGEAAVVAHGPDRYRLVLSNGYDSGDHALSGGDVQIH